MNETARCVRGQVVPSKAEDVDDAVEGSTDNHTHPITSFNDEAIACRVPVSQGQKP